MEKATDLKSYFEKANIPPGAYSFNTECATLVLHKYISSERVFSCLPEIGDGTLRATQPSSLNDPFECAVHRIFVERSEKEGNAEVSRILTDLNPTSPIGEGDVAEARVEFGSLFLRELLSRQMSKRFGIVSFATDPRHPLMWSHYTGDGSGFVIGYDMTHLIGLSSGEGRLRPVIYEHKPVAIIGYKVLNEGNINALLSKKSDHWKYEQEWRLIVPLNETIGTEHVDRHGHPINLLRISNEAVVRVYHTERTPIELVNEVRKRLQNPNNRYRAQHPVKLILSETEFRYTDADLSSSQL